MGLQAQAGRHKQSWSRGSLPKLVQIYGNGSVMSKFWRSLDPGWLSDSGYAIHLLHEKVSPTSCQKTAGGGVDRSKIPLPKMPSKGYNAVPKSHAVFSKSGDETPYFQDSHMITPKSSGKKERPDRDSGRANATRSTMRGAPNKMES
ncbi:hypothetical protein PHMEG_00013907 [Phytophthora megakarya]|uniref:Uncharacterized protein n=1 Tax=Phytophthora megakarya TaxID=4795 RepID=A0A225W6R8_9STRA|nr:hypothetical protein PHMEG_00013907 [Phytophthora megakarya]